MFGKGNIFLLFARFFFRCWVHSGLLLLCPWDSAAVVCRATRKQLYAASLAAVAVYNFQAQIVKSPIIQPIFFPSIDIYAYILLLE